MKNMELLIELFRRLLDYTDTAYVRYLHDRIDWSARMIGIVGPRGVGKTTMLLQHIKLYHSVKDTLSMRMISILRSTGFTTWLLIFTGRGESFFS